MPTLRLTLVVVTNGTDVVQSVAGYIDHAHFRQAAVGHATHALGECVAGGVPTPVSVRLVVRQVHQALRGGAGQRGQGSRGAGRWRETKHDIIIPTAGLTYGLVWVQPRGPKTLEGPQSSKQNNYISTRGANIHNEGPPNFISPRAS